ncbi:MAG: DUF4175 domain-containing protein [Planctomycetes bacterium]|nr:DUF4175 domain-containing protein [Planctomycetota bacterium]
MNPSSQTVALAPPPAAPPLAAARSVLAGLRARARAGIWIETLGVVGLLLVAYALPSYVTDRGLRLEWFYRCLLLLSFLAVVARVVVRRLVRPLEVRLGDEELALAVERRAPEVRQELISALQFETALAGTPRGDSQALMAAVVDGLRRRLGGIPFARAIDADRVRRFAAATAVALLFFGGWAALDPRSLGTWAARNLALANVDWPRYTSLGFAGVPAGGVRLPQGDPLTVRVEVAGPVPDQVFLSYAFASGEHGTEPMSGTGEREFTLVLDAVLGDVVLTAAGGDALPVELRVGIVERPRIADLGLRVTFPGYMERDPEQVPPTEGELRLPRGAKLAVQGRAQKLLDEAFVLLGGDQKLALSLGADRLSFVGELAPETSGLLTVDVIDQDRLGSGAPPKLLLRVGDDKPPTVDFRLRGIGTLVTAHARIPGDLKVKDDFGIRAIDAAMRAVEDTPAEAAPGGNGAGAAPKPPEAPFENVLASYVNPLPRSAQRYESPASVDFVQWNPEPDQDARGNRIRPGMLVSLRFSATDNFGPGEPHRGSGETLVFRVVTREKLFEELRRRQVEQRQELERIIADEQTALLTLRETMGPQQAGPKLAEVVARFKTLARLQQALGRRVALVGDLYQRILWEYENNRLIEANKVRQMEALIPQPLAAVAKEAFPATSRLVEAFAASGQEATRTEAAAGYEDALRRLQEVLKQMEQAENLAALLEDLRVVIKMEDAVIQDVENRKRALEQDLFGPGKERGAGQVPPPKDPPQDPPKK